MFNQQLFVKPKGVRYVDMAIYIDNHVYDENPDYDLIYSYMYLLAYMLSCKAKYFNSKEDYEEFSSILAYSVYQRMTDRSKGKIKSVLNYMKSIMFFRKAAYEVQRHQEIINPDAHEKWDALVYKTNYIESLETSKRDILVDGVVDTFKYLPTIINKNIPKVYKSNKATYSNLYISCLLSMINKVSLPNEDENKLQSYLDESPTFNEVKFYKKHLDDGVILWHLDQSMSTVVKMIMNKVGNKLVDEIKELSNDIKITEGEFDSILASSFGASGVNDETDY